MNLYLYKNNLLMNNIKLSLDSKIAFDLNPFITFLTVMRFKFSLPNLGHKRYSYVMYIGSLKILRCK